MEANMENWSRKSKMAAEEDTHKPNVFIENETKNIPGDFYYPNTNTGVYATQSIPCLVWSSHISYWTNNLAKIHKFSLVKIP